MMRTKTANNLFCIIAIMLLSLVMLSCSVYADGDMRGSDPANDVTWSLEDGTLTIYDASAMNDYKDYKSAPWYVDRARIEEVVFNANITRIGNYSFFDCVNLTDVTVPDGVTEIGDFAFSGCKSLTAFTFPASVRSIGTYAFQQCKGITCLDVPASVTNLGEDAFFGCGLTEITIPFCVKLYGCPDLQKVTILGGTDIPDNAFTGCSKLSDITLPDSLTTIGSHAFHGCTGLTSFTVPENVTFIGRNAFGACRNMTEIRIPETVTGLGPYVFENCSKSLVADTPRGSYAYYYALCYGVVVKEKININECKISGLESKTYTGKSIKQKLNLYYPLEKIKDPNWTFHIGLEEGRDYTVSYNNNKAVGTATLVIKGKGSYTGSIRKTFKIIPKGVTIKKPAAKRKAFTAKWKRRYTKMHKKQIAGYQVQYSRDGTFKKGVKSVKVKGVNRKSKKIKKLSARKNYYVRVRTYMKVKGKTYYSKWSVVMKVKTK